MKRKLSFDYCGKRYGLPYYICGFLLGAALGFAAGHILYETLVFDAVTALIFGIIFSKQLVQALILKRRKQFSEEFCDFLDSIGSSLSCGKNTYGAFMSAHEDIKGMYKKDSPIYVESERLAAGLKNGRQITELIEEMAVRSGNEDVRIFGDVYSICNDVGGNLKRIVNNTKSVISEKAEIEAEIGTLLAEPKNELRIMSFMPFVITTALKSLGEQFAPVNSVGVNSVALFIFVLAYFIGSRIVDIKV